MSGAVKSVKKIFKKVVKGIRKVAPVLLAAAALYYTVGAALGVQSAAGGWGQAVKDLGSYVGLESGSALTNILTGAVTSAGYGAILGGGTAFATGSDPIKGAGIGAVGGGILGGVAGANNINIDPFENISGGGSPTASLTPGQMGIDDGVDALAGGGGTLLTGARDATQGSGGGLLPKAITENQTLIGGIIGGIGKGMGSAAEASATRDAARITADTNRDAKAAEAARIAGNYSGSGAGILQAGATDYIAGQPARPTPRGTPRFNPQGGGYYVYNPQKGVVEYTPPAA